MATSVPPVAWSSGTVIASHHISERRRLSITRTAVAHGRRGGKQQPLRVARCRAEKSDGAAEGTAKGTKSSVPSSGPSGPTSDASLPVQLAWYASEAFGKAVAVFRPPRSTEPADEEEKAVISREEAVSALKEDYSRSYFVTGDMSMWIYDPNCEFADPFVSFYGRQRFKQNVSNLGSFMEEVSLKILDWQESDDKITTKWRFSCVLGLPWRPILAASGGTDHYFDPSTGKIVKHVERWDISPLDGLRQLVKPNPKLRKK